MISITMKSIVILIAIASIAILGFAPPAKSACSGCDSKAVKKEAPKAKTAAKKSCCSEKAAKKEAKKHECCGKDPFIMEANRMAAASEGKKSTGCACEDKANAKKKASQPAKK